MAQELEESFSLVRGGVLYRLLVTLRVIPPDGLGIGRRIVLGIAITWLPLVILAALAGRLFQSNVDEPFLPHYGVHTKFLLALPIMIAMERLVDKWVSMVPREFLRRGMVRESNRQAFDQILLSAQRMRDSTLVFIACAAVAGLIVLYRSRFVLHAHDTAWALSKAHDYLSLSAGGWWYILVAQPIFIFLSAQWLLRLLILFVMLRRISSLDIHLIPTHPDHRAGLGFLEVIPLALAPLAFAQSSIIAGSWAHDVLYHNLHVDSLKISAIVLVLVMTLLCLAPLLPLRWSLLHIKWMNLLEYGALFSRHGQLIEKKWILKEPVEDELLAAPEFGPVADITTLYDGLKSIRVLPVDQRVILTLLVAAALPLLPVFTLEIPFKDIILKMGATLL